jgi:hypothetical protein
MKKKKVIKKKTEVLRVTGEEKVQKPHHVPVDVFIQEAKNLYRWAGEDQEELTAVGLAPDLIEDLPNRCEALSQAEAQWFVERNTRQEAVKTCADICIQAAELKNRILEEFAYGFRNYPELLKAAREIKKVKGKVALVQDLIRISVLGKRNPGILSTIGFNMALSEQAGQLASILRRAIAAAGDSERVYYNSKQNRDRAYTHLKRAVDEIRACGRFVFRDNKERARGYTSNHMRQQNARKALNAKKAAAEIPAESAK